MDKSTKWNRKQTKVAIIHSRSFQYTLDDGAQYRLLERINKLVEGGDLSTFSPERSFSPPGTINASSPTSFHFLDLRPSRTNSTTSTSNASSNVVQSMSLHGEGTTAIGSPARIRRANNLIKSVKAAEVSIDSFSSSGKFSLSSASLDDASPDFASFGSPSEERPLSFSVSPPSSRDSGPTHRRHMSVFVPGSGNSASMPNDVTSSVPSVTLSPRDPIKRSKSSQAIPRSIQAHTIAEAEATRDNGNLRENLTHLSLRKRMIYKNSRETIFEENDTKNGRDVINFNSTLLGALPSQIGLVHWLKALYLEDNQIPSIPPEIKSLTLLRTLSLSHNRLSSLPNEIGELKSLTELNLDSNLLMALPKTLGNLHNLETLLLNNNELSSIPLECQALTELQQLDLSGNPLIFPPRAIVEDGAQTVVAYLKNTSTKNKPCHKGKLCVLGDDDSGKTTFTKHLRGKKGQKERSKNAAGVSIHNWMLPVTMETTTVNIKFRIWEFDGRELYGGIHHLFFSERAVYCILWNMTKREKGMDTIEYWLHMIESRARDSPVLIIGTHADEMSAEDVTTLEETLIERFSGRFENVKGILPINNLTSDGMQYVKLSIEKIASQYGPFHEEIPSNYKAFQRILIEERKKRTPPVITQKKYAQWAQMCGIPEGILSRVSHYFNSIGAIHHFPDLPHVVLLDPTWFYTCVNHLVNQPPEIIFEGLLSSHNIPKIWPRYNTEVQTFIMTLMSQCQICLQFDREGGRHIDMVLPSLLPDQAPPLHLLSDHVSLSRVYKLSFMSRAFSSSFLARLLEMNYYLTKKRSTVPFWRTGIVLRDYARETIPNTAIVELDRSNKTISLLVGGPSHPVSLLRPIEDLIHLLISNWYPCEMTKFVKVEEEMIPFSDCEVAVAAEKEKIEWNGISHTLTSIVPEFFFDDFTGRKNFSDLTITQQIGRGAFGDISLASVEYDGEKKDIAVKQLTTSLPEERLHAIREWKHELEMQQKMRHPNVTNYRGFCISPPCILMDYSPHGTLHNLIHDQEQSLPWNMVLKLASDIASGMAYLHTQSPAILHRDLKTPNILLYSMDVHSETMAKVADFGTATPSYINHFRSRLVDQPLWLAPEIMVGRPYDEKSDVYSFAIILWEMLSRKMPFDEFPFANWYSQLEDSIVAGTRPTVPGKTHPGYKRLIIDCWSGNPAHRPSFTEIKTHLTHITKSNTATSTVELSDATYQFDVADNEDNIILDEDRFDGSLAKAASITKLVERITSPDCKENTHMSDVFLTHRMFTTSEELLDLLILRYHGPPPAASPDQKLKFHRDKAFIMIMVIEGLYVWSGMKSFVTIKERVRDSLEVMEGVKAHAQRRSVELEGDKLMDEHKHLHTLESLKKNVSSKSHHHSDSSLLLDEWLKLYGDEKKEEVRELNHRRRASSAASKEVKKETLARTEPRVLAQQMTLLDTHYLRSVDTDELLDVSGIVQGEKKKTITRYQDYFNERRNWISTEIIKGETPQERAEIIDYYIQVAVRLQELQNYNGLMMVLTSLYSDAVTWLSSSWREVPKKTLETFETLSKLMSPQYNYKSYHAALQDIADEPVIPYIASFLNEFVFMDTTMQWKINGSLVNIEKILALGKMIRKFQKYAENATRFISSISPIERVQRSILCAAVWEEEDIVTVAHVREGINENLQQGGSNTTIRQFRKLREGGRNKIVTDITSLPSRDWDLLLTNARIMPVKTGQEVLEQNIINTHLYRIISGRFVVRKDGKEHSLSRLGPGAIFGEMSFLGLRTSASILSEEEGQLHVLEIKLVKRLFAMDPDLFRSFYQYLATLLAKRLKKVSEQAPTVSPLLNSPDLRPTRGHSEKTVGSEDAEGREEDDKFRRRFKLDTEEIIIKEYNCIQKRCAGRLYLSKQHICFYANVFGMKRKKTYPFASLKAMWRDKKMGVVVITLSGDKGKFSFASLTDRSEAFDMMESLWTSSAYVRSGGSVIRQPMNEVNANAGEEEDTEGLTTEDRAALLEGAKTQKYEENQEIVSIGADHQRVYQIDKGVCRIERGNQILGFLQEGQFFGEISFLLSGGATATIVAHSDQVELSILEGYFINILFGIRPEMAGRFYKHLANILQRRIREREDEPTGPQQKFV
ncbi:hypothetical protein PROFUN_00385 [Planoprotostelium fungivorum]|uniref:non-specific serine/threonine protein kinase n=1 Tax=Planoprotostelium fungivorum TaxID=1890364 RepID=A0A2P6NY80_9EUKA|nr:hypothetical protein PROFUN_00385 [Planoprotostelium fungivorum]